MKSFSFFILRCHKTDLGSYILGFLLCYLWNLMCLKKEELAIKVMKFNGFWEKYIGCFFSNLLLQSLTTNLKFTLVLILAFGLMLDQIGVHLLAQAFRITSYAFVVLEVVPVFVALSCLGGCSLSQHCACASFTMSLMYESLILT